MALHHPSKRLKAGSSDCAGPNPSPPQSRQAINADTNALLSPSFKSVRPSAMRGDPVGRFKAEKWFNDTNKDASCMKDVSFLDEDPPFYINRQPSSGGNSVRAVRSDGSPLDRTNLGPSTGPTRDLLARMESSESNSEDFRSVIDDLTIQNKKLKRKLKKYEKLHCSHLQEEKLFEVRIHGLAAHRKRELEETLRSFASSIKEASPQSPRDQPDSLQNLIPGDPLASLRKLSSSSTSNSKPIDSAYASMSGQTGLSLSQLQDRNKQERPGQATQSKQQNVNSYLHDIPEPLMPNHSMAMSERSKSKLVVKKLEQIFTGKGAASRRHPQSHQQQEVSQSAAQADQKHRGRPAAREGKREARILPEDTELQVDPMGEANLAAKLSRSSNDGSDSARNTQASRDNSPEQRPTRPLDLDLHRAQIPSDNMEYIRHLGLASQTSPSDKISEDVGWLPLNLLISMAQLHTLNVTLEYIRHAVTDDSAKFELSADGTKLRWQGGTEGTRMSSDSGDSEDISKWKSAETSHSASKRGSFAELSEAQEPNSALPALASESSAAPETGAKRRPVFLGQANDGSKFHYKPLFFHAEPSEEEDDDSAPSTQNSSSDWRENATGLNSGLNSGSHGLRESEARLRLQNQGNGPIIFYYKARFCTDLSRDFNGAMIHEDAYVRYTESPVGCSPATSSEHEDEDNKLNRANMDTEESMEVDIDSNKTNRSALDLEDLKSSISDCASSPRPMDMEASGLGGILPKDNFVVKVQVLHGKKFKGRGSRKQSSFSSGRVNTRRELHKLARRNIDVFRAESRIMPRSRPPSAPRTEIISAVKRDLPPSSLPPPSYNFSTSDYDDDEGDDEKHGSILQGRVHHVPPRSSVDNAVSSRPADFFIGSSSEETKESSCVSGSDDDSSIDLLAHARVLDPVTIAAQEREFDNNAPQSSAQHLPPSSAAATVGEQSGHTGQKVARMSESDVDSMSVEGDGSSESGQSS